MRKKLYCLFVVMLVAILACSTFGLTALADSDPPAATSTVTPADTAPAPTDTAPVTTDTAPAPTDTAPVTTDTPAPADTTTPEDTTAPSPTDEPAPAPSDTTQPAPPPADTAQSTSPIRFGAIGKQNDDYYTMNPDLQVKIPSRITDNAAISPAESKLSSNLLRLTGDNNLPSGTTKDQVITQMKRTNEVKDTDKSASGSSGTSVHVYINLEKGADYDTLSPYVSDLEKDKSDGFAVGWVDTGSLDKLASLKGVKSIEEVTPPIVQTGSVVSEGDSVLKAVDMRNATGLDGTGIKVGIISDGVDHLASSKASGDLPSDVKVLSNTVGGDEGTAMLEIVHDLAPGAQLDFHDYGDDIYDFDNAIDALAADGCNVICDDVSWTTEPFFEDGTIAQHVTNLLATSNIIYCTSAGNQAYDHYQGKYQKSKKNYGYDNLADLSHGNKKTGPFVWVHVPWGESVYVVLQWNDPFGASSNDYDLYMMDDSGWEQAWSENVQSGTQDPIEELTFTNDDYDDDYENFAILVTAANSSALSSKKTLEIYMYYDSGDCYSYANNRVMSDSIYGQAAVPGVLTCAAIDANPNDLTKAPKGYVMPLKGQLEYYSSRGPVTMISGVRKKPDICGVDGVSITGAGDFGSYDYDNDTYYFYGTSAASPHIGAIAALLLERFPAGTSASVIRQAITGKATDKGSKGYDYSYGSGEANALSSAVNNVYLQFDSNGGSAVAPELVSYNGKAIKPANPTKATYLFGGWYTDAALTHAVSFSTKLKADATYYAKWLDSPYLTGISLSGGLALSPTFSQTRYAYTVNLDEFTDSVDITPTLVNSAASMTINGLSGVPYTATVQKTGYSTPVKIIITSNGGTKTYVITVKRAKSTDNKLSGITATDKNGAPLSLDKTFDKNTTDYTITLDENTPSVVITPTKENSQATVYIDGKVKSSKTYTVETGYGATCVIKVVAQNSTKNYKTYTVHITRDPSTVDDLSNIMTSSSLCPISPYPFSTGTTSYTVNLPANMSSIKLYAAKANKYETVKFDGVIELSKLCNVASGSSITVHILVISQYDVKNGGSTYTQEYDVTINRG